MEEKRKSPRVRTFKGGRLVFNDGRSTLDCVVRNISEGGAKLSFNQVAAIPDVFDITIDGTSRPCRIVWRKSLDVGVSFEAAGQAAEAAPRLAETR